MSTNIIEWLYLRQPNNLAYHDAFTKLKNRNWWEIEAEKIYRNKECYFSILDLDNLKEINDNEGHAAGDKIIKDFSYYLKNVFSTEENVPIIRFGGDEFIILSKTNPIDKYFLLLKKFNFSFGIIHKDKEENLSRALKQADKEMYEMKVLHHN